MPRKPAADDPSIPIIASNLRRARLDLGLQSGPAAEKAHVGRTMLSKWENAGAKPEVDALLKIAVAYECSVDDLVVGVNEDYDRLTAKGLRADARRHVQGRLAALRQQIVTTLALVEAGGEAAEKSAGAPVADRAATADRSKPARARRARKKKPTE